MTKRFVYRLLIRSHPQRFREQFGEEMLSIFDELAPEKSLQLIGDGILSLLRQRLLRSNLWKMACGTAISVVFFFVWAAALQNSMDASMWLGIEQSLRLQWEPPPPCEASFDMVEFRRQAASAVALLAEIRKRDQQARRAQRHRARRTEPSAPSEETHTQG